VARVPVTDPLRGRVYTTLRVDVDEASLQEIAETTGGRYFRATNREGLEEIYREIDQLERTEIQVENFTRYGERFPPVLVLGLVLLLLETGLSGTVLRRLP
jgi:Ca-activated chloride channel family protein